MILRFRAYSRSNRDIDEVLQRGALRGHQVNNQIIVFGNTIVESEITLAKVYHEIIKYASKRLECTRGSFTVEVDDMIGLVIKEKYRFKQVKPSKQECEMQYLNNWTTNAQLIRTCADCEDCEDFGTNGCKSSYIEAKYGNKNTPACSDIKLKV